MKFTLSGFCSFCIFFAAVLSSTEAAILVVTNTADAGPGTLRQAIIDANAAPGADVIHWNFLGGEREVYLNSALPDITDTLTIDGTTQPGYAGVPFMSVYLPFGTNGLVITATNCVVRGMLLVNCLNSIVLRDTARGTILGGTNSGDGNLLTYAVNAGIRIEGGSGHVLMGNSVYAYYGVGIQIAGGSNCVIQGNRFSDNGGPGVLIEGGVKCSLQSNEIAFNSGAGVAVLGGTNHSIRANSIYGNGGLGIDLGGDGVTLNDDKDPDEGANHLQNYPILTTATYSGSNVVIVGTLNSRPNTTFTVDFYANLVCDESGYGEGRQHLGSTNLTTANNGNRNFTATFTNLLTGHYVTGTATDPAGNTSEFSPCVRLSSTVAPTTFTVTNVNDAGPGSLRQAILNSNARFASGPNAIAFNIPGSGVHRILLTSEPLPQITESVIIDGYTQPGSSVNTASNAFNGVVRIRLDGILLGYGRALDITAGSSTVRGLNIMNFAYAAVACSGEGSNTISGNLIGITTDGEVGPTGSFSGGSYEASIVLASSSNSLVGGTNAAGRNVVAGGGYGDLWLSGSSSNRVLGNFFGCDTTGTNGIGAFGFGVNVDGSTGNVIGGTNSLLRNVFLGHGGSDVLVLNASAQNVVQGNYLGVGTDGNPHDGGGMFLWGGSHDTLIGGTNSGSANLISGTVYIYDGTGNAVLRNSMVNGSNGGIDLGQDGPTPNDPDDSDTGANNLQNYPEILSAIRYPNRTVIRSRLQSVPSATYRIDFYDNDRPPPFGFTEARTWIGTTNVTLGASGQTNFNWSPAATLTPGHWVTATATDATNNTSELAPPVVVALSNEVNMVLTLNASIDPVSRTSNFTYTVEVRNLGPTNATGVVLSNFLPANVSFVSASTTQGSCALAGGIVTCSLGGMTNGAMATVALTVHPLTNGPAELTARVAASQPESYPPDNVAVGGPFAGIADIDVVSGSLIPNPVTAGQMYDTLITITNLGPDSALVRIQVDWTWPDVPVSITTSQGTVMLSGVTFIFADVGMLPAGGSSVITLRSLHAQAWSGGIGVIAGGDGFDPDGPDYFSGSPSIVPGPGVFTLENSAEEVGETDGSALLRVVRYGGAVGSVTVNYATSPGSATVGADYTPVSGMLSFADGETEKFISVPVLDDFLAECGESFTVTLSNPTGGATFLYNGNTNCVVQILDNDPSLRGVVAGASVTATNANAAGDGFSASPSLSDDGRFLAFESASRNLVAGGPEVSYDVFVRDLMTGTTTLASVNRFGTNGADNGAYQPRLSATGRYLAFVSAGNNLVTNDNSSGHQQVYLRDMVSGTTRLLSTLAAGSSGATGNSDNALITSNGLGVAFNSSAADASAVPDANAANDVYFRDVSSDVTHLVSVNRWGTAAGNGDSFLPYFANNASYRTHGRYVGFTSRASDLVIGDNNGFADVFVRDLTNGVTTLVSMNRLGTGSGNADSYDPLVSADGRFVLFYSSSSDLVANDTNETGDVFVRDLVAGTTRMVSVNRFGTASANGYSFHSGFSADGRYALFLSDASDLAEDDVNGTTDIFVRDLVAGTTTLVSRSCNGSGTGNNSSGNASISPDGRYVAFTSDATDLVSGAGGGGHAYLRDLATGTTTLLSGNWRGGVSPWGGCFGTAVANGAATVAFLSEADDLLPIDENFSPDIFAWKPFLSSVADLSIDQFDGPDPAPAGTSITYTIGVRNHGPTNATDVTLIDTLPPGAQLVSATPSQGSCSNLGGIITCHLSGLAPSALATIQIVAQLAGPGLFTNITSASASQSDPQMANNTSTEVTVRTGMADLDVRMNHTPARVAVGQAATFTITVSNLGPNTANGVVITNAIPPGVVYSSPSASQGTVLIDGLVAVWQAGSIPAPGSATLLIDAIPTMAGPFTHAATVSSTDADPVSSNNSATNTTFVVSNWGQFRFSQSAYTTSEGAGSVMITVTRDGENDAIVSVGYSTEADGGITPGSDYTSVAGTLVFTNGQASRTVTVPILEDAEFECSESFRVLLSNPAGGAVLSEPAIATVLIVDNDAGSAAEGGVVGVSVVHGCPQTTGPSYGAAIAQSSISYDGRYVAFDSAANGLVPGDKDYGLDVFVRDLWLGQTKLVAVRGQAGFAAGPVISGNGRFVAFTSFGPVTTNAVVTQDVYVSDLATDVTRLVSVTPSGRGGNSVSGGHVLSSTGRIVVFMSQATNLVTVVDTNGNWDVFAWDAATGQVRLVSVNRFGMGAGNASSSQPVVSANGRFVAFISSASDLAPNDTNGDSWDIYVRDLISNTTTLVSVNLSGNGSGNAFSQQPAMSADGRYVAFSSWASDLVADDSNGWQDVFVRDMVLGVTRLVSVNSAGTGSANNYSAWPSISADGRYVAFESASSDLAPGDAPWNYDVFVRDLVTGSTTLASGRCDGLGVGNNTSWRPAISADGRRVAFLSYASNLTPDFIPVSVENVFRHDLTTGKTVLCSQNHLRTGGANSRSENISISANGDALAFVSYATDLVPQDNNSVQDVFAWLTGPLPPLLSIHHCETQVLVNWPASAAGYQLESATSLLAPIQWQMVTNAFLSDGVFKTLVLPSPSQGSQKFFRLSHP